MTRNNRLSLRTSSNSDPSQVGHQVGRETDVEIQTDYLQIEVQYRSSDLHSFWIKGCHQLQQYFLNIYIFNFNHTWFEWNDAPKTHLAFGEAVSDCWQKEIRGHWLAIKNWKCCQASFFHFQFHFFLSSPKQMIWRRVISSTMSLFDWILSLGGHFQFQDDPFNDFLASFGATYSDCHVSYTFPCHSSIFCT